LTCPITGRSGVEFVPKELYKSELYKSELGDFWFRSTRREHYARKTDRVKKQDQERNRRDYSQGD
jgi:hypothetical protein